MNRIYKVVFNKTICAYTAVSELASFKGKKSVKAAVAVGLAGLMMAGAVSAAGLSGGKDGTPENPSETKAYTGTVDGLSGAYAASNGEVTADAVEVKKYLYGGYDYAVSGSESRAMASSNNTVTVTNGSDLGSKNVTGGTVSAANDVTVTSVAATGNGITVEEDSVADGGVLQGASVNIQKEVTGTLTVDGNTVDVTGKSAAATQFTLVYGADVYGNVGGDVSVSGNKANVSQATISLSFVGVHLAVPSTTSEGVNLKADKNEAGLTDVALAGYVNVYGADITSFGAAKDVSLSENKVTLDNVTSTKSSVLGGYVEFINGVRGTLDANGNEVSVTGKSAADTKFVSVEGAYVSANSVGGDVSASRNKVGVSKAAIGSDSSTNRVQGVRLAVGSTTSEDVNLKADKNEVGLTDVELASGGVYVYGANIESFGTAKDVSLNENKITLDNVTSTKGSVYGGYASLGDGVKGTLDVNGNEVSVTGKSAADTKFDTVEGAYVYALSVGGDVSVSGNKANVSQATISRAFEGVRLTVKSTTSEGVNLKAEKNEAGLTDVELASGGVDVYGAAIVSDGTAKDVSLSENKVTLSNVTSTESSVSGGYVKLINGVRGTLDANGNEVSVTGKSAADTKFDSVEGAYVYAKSVGGDVSVSGNKANVSQATISSAFEGVRLDVKSTTSEGVNLKADKNEAGLTDVELASGVEGVYGANIGSFGTAKDVSLSENKVTLSNVTSTESSVLGGYALFDNGVKGTLDVNKNEVIVTGKSAADTKFDSVEGAYVSAYSIGGDVSVSGNKANVSQATIIWTFEGVRLDVGSTTSEGVNLKADKNEAVLTDVELASGGVTVNGAAIVSYGTAKDVSLSENKVTLDNVTSTKGSVYGGYVSLGDGVKGTLDANKNAVSVTGKSAADTKFDSVEGAYLYANSVGGDVSVSGNKVTVTKAKIAPHNSYDRFSGASLKLGAASGSNVAVTANGNTFTLKDAESAGADIYGVNLENLSGQVTGVSFSENKVTLDKSKAAGGNIYGASVDAASATASGAFDLKKNEVTVTGISKTDTVLENAYGVSAEVKMAAGSVTASENKVNLTDAKLFGDGDGYAVAAKVSVSATGDGEVNVTAEKNVLTAKGADSTSDFTGAYVGLTGDEKINRVTIDGNTATVENGELWGNVTGADFYIGENSGDKVTVGSAEVKNNKATVKGVTATNIVGADVKGDNVTLSGNEADVSGNSDVDFVAGTSAVGDGATLTDNKATVTDSTVKDGDDGVYGAEVNGNNATVSGNSATVSNSQVLSHTVDGSEIGGYVQGAEVIGDNAKISGNSATVKTNSTVEYVSGAFANGNGNELTNNVATVSDSTVKGASDDDVFRDLGIVDGVIGAEAVGDNAVISGNTVNVSNSDVSAANVAAAQAIGAGAKLTGNTTNVSDGSSAQNIFGAFAVGDSSEVKNNETNVDGSTVGNAVAGAVAAGNGSDVQNNTAKVIGSTVENIISGAAVTGDGTTVSGNTANVTDTTTAGASGADVEGDNVTASGNTVSVGGDSVVKSGVLGVYAEGDNNVLTKNTVNLSGNTEFKDGAVVFAAAGVGDTDDSTNTVRDNTVNVTDSVKLSNVDMYGRRKDNQGSGNTLNLNNWQGKIKSVNYFDNVNVKTSSADPEQVVIGDLVKGNADTQINIGLDGKASRELEEKTSTAEEAAIGASKVVKLEDVDGSAEHNEKFNVNIAEGDVSGEITAEVWEDGSVDNLVVKALHEKENSVMKSLTNIAANNFLVFRQQMNDLNKRMGDLRTMPQSDGVWGRAVAGQAEYKQMHSTYKTLQVGADKRIGQFLVGATASYTDADGSLKNGSSDDKNYTYGIYGSWLGDNGHYVDVIVKRHHVQSDYDLRYTDGRRTDGMMHTSGTSISAEYGKRFAITNTNFYVEPQVEVMWGHLDSDSYKLSNGVQIKQDGIDSLIGRLGVAAGWVSPDKKGSAYIKASVLNDWEAESDVTARKGATVRKYTEDMGGTWGEFAIGGTYNFCKNFSAYGEVETTAGNPTRTTYQASAGIRYSF